MIRRFLFRPQTILGTHNSKAVIKMKRYSGHEIHNLAKRLATATISNKSPRRGDHQVQTASKRAKHGRVFEPFHEPDAWEVLRELNPRVFGQVTAARSGHQNGVLLFAFVDRVVRKLNIGNIYCATHRVSDNFRTLVQLLNVYPQYFERDW